MLDWCISVGVHVFCSLVSSLDYQIVKNCTHYVSIYVSREIYSLFSFFCFTQEVTEDVVSISQQGWSSSICASRNIKSIRLLSNRKWIMVIMVIEGNFQRCRFSRAAFSLECLSFILMSVHVSLLWSYCGGSAEQNWSSLVKMFQTDGHKPAVPIHWLKPNIT